LGEVRRGILNVTVTHSALLEELVSFRKAGLLGALRLGAPATAIHDIRFRVGAVVPEVEQLGETASSLSSSLSELKPSRRRQAALKRRAVPGKSKPDRDSGAGTGSAER